MNKNVFKNVYPEREEEELYISAGQLAYWTTLFLTSSFCLSYSFGYHLAGPLFDFFFDNKDHRMPYVEESPAPVESEIVKPLVTYNEDGSLNLEAPEGYELAFLDNGKVICQKDLSFEDCIAFDDDNIGKAR